MIVWLSGGLGNQLFQFAFGRALARTSGARVLYCASFYSEPNVSRSYELDKLGLKVPIIRQTPRVNFDKGIVRIRRPLRLALHSSPIKRTFRLINEPEPFVYVPEFLMQTDNCYFKGYWQTTNYMEAADIAADVRMPFADMDAKGRGLLARLKRGNSVAVHVRRTDYLLPWVHDVHGLCSMRYYASAMSLIKARLPSAEFFVFSDDHQWCRDAFSGTGANIVDVHSPALAHLDLALMASCRHHIIANSSFSWLAAWFARHDEQIVVGPTPWTTVHGRARDLFAPNWIVLDRDTGMIAD